MKIAVTYENGQVFQHFGHTEAFKVYETENNEIKSESIITTLGIKLYGGVMGSADEAVKALLCGTLDFNPEVHCSHHDGEHDHGTAHTCGEHGCHH